MKDGDGFDGRAVANFVLDFCAQQDLSVTNLKLQKLIYFCHVWTLLKLGRPLIRHKFEAWRFGPVLQYVYREFKEYDDQPVVKRATRMDPDSGSRVLVEYNFDTDVDALLSEVTGFYSRLTSRQLVELSHVPNGPWYRVWYHKGNINPGMKIENEDIVKFYGQVQPPFPVQ